MTPNSTLDTDRAARHARLAETYRADPDLDYGHVRVAPFTDTPDVAFRGLTLNTARYKRTADGGAAFHDDGIIDETAVDRHANGHVTTRISPREVVCVIAALAAAGQSDAKIAAHFRRPNDTGRLWVGQVRARNGIPAAVIAPVDDFEVAA